MVTLCFKNCRKEKQRTEPILKKKVLSASTGEIHAKERERW